MDWHVSFEEGTKAIKGIYKKATELIEVELPESVEEICDEAFVNWMAWKDVKIHFSENLKRIGKRALYGFRTDKLQLPGSLEEIDDEAFADSWIREEILSLPKNLKRIGKGAFKNATLPGRIELPENLEKIGEGAFEGTDLIEIKFLGTVKKEVFMQLGELPPFLEKIIIEVPSKKGNREISFHVRKESSYDSSGKRVPGKQKSLTELWEEIEKVYKENSYEKE